MEESCWGCLPSRSLVNGVRTSLFESFVCGGGVVAMVDVLMGAQKTMFSCVLCAPCVQCVVCVALCCSLCGVHVLCCRVCEKKIRRTFALACMSMFTVALCDVFCVVCGALCFVAFVKRVVLCCVLQHPVGLAHARTCLCH